MDIKSQLLYRSSNPESNCTKISLSTYEFDPQHWYAQVVDY